MDNNLDYEIFKAKLNKVIIRDTNYKYVDLIDCFKKDNYLMILIKNDEEIILNSLMDLIKQVVSEYPIIDSFIIANLENQKEIYFASNDDKNLTNNTEDNSVIKKHKIYSSANFSISFILFIFGLFSLITIGSVFYFTRPCVFGKCELILQTENSISNLFKDKSQNLNVINIRNLQSGLISAINDLKRVPRWSQYYDDASLLIQEYQNQVTELDNLLLAFKSMDTAKNLTQNLPLSLDEWNRVKTFWQEAIAIINQLTIKELETFKQEQLNIYRNQLKIIEKGINQEKLADNLLIEGKNKAIKIELEQKQITNLSDLEKIEKDWKIVIKKIELIPSQTIAYLEKQQTLNNYLLQLSQIQQKISLEKTALNTKKLAEEKIKLAKDSQKNNQWTKAVALWKEAINILNKIPSQVLGIQEINNIKIQSNKELEIAQLKLKEAIKNEIIKKALKNICNNQELICTYQVNQERAKIFLTEEYLQKIASLSSNANQENLITNHINQVEKNYKYISSKYKINIELYNPQKQLIMIYNPPIQ